MSTRLSRTTAFARKFLFFGIIAIVVLTTTQLITYKPVTVKPTIRPSGTSTTQDGCTAPDSKYSSLPAIKIKSLSLSPGTKAIFSADRSTAKFPTFPSSAYVYKLSKIYEKLDDVDTAKLVAQNLGFNSNPTSSTDGSLTWSNQNETKFLAFDKAKFSWNMSTDFNKYELTMLGDKTDVYQKLNESVIMSISLINKSYSTTEAEYTYIVRKNDNSLANVGNLLQANILSTNYYKVLPLATCEGSGSSRETTHTSRIISPEYLDQSLNVQLSGSNLNIAESLVSLKMREFELATEDAAIYPTITMAEAFLLLQTNKGILYWLLPDNGNIFSKYEEQKVKEFRIATDSTKIVYLEPQQYIENDESTQYYQPYYQFVGQATLENDKMANFIFLVRALDPNSYI